MCAGEYNCTDRLYSELPGQSYDLDRIDATVQQRYRRTRALAEPIAGRPTAAVTADGIG
jgi:hypothetical protein